MESLWQDLRFGWRMLRSRPIVTIVAMLSLVIGIAMSAVVFSLLDAAVLRPLPVTQPQALAIVLSRRGDGINHNFSYPDFVDYRRAQQAFTDLIAYGRIEVTLRKSGGARVVPGEIVSGNYFSMLGVKMRFGRALTDADDSAGSPAVAVVSAALWRDLTGAGAGFEPRQILINEREFAVVGVVASFHGMNVGRDVQVWAPMHQQPVLQPLLAAGMMERRTASWLTLLGRLRPTTTFDAAAADLNRVEAALGPSVNRQDTRTFLVQSGRQGDSSMPGATAAPLELLLGAALLVLLVACANVANLLAAKASDRRREMAVRVALGASRARVARLVVIEALTLCLVSAGLAVIASIWGARAAVHLLPNFGEPVALEIGIDWRLASFVSLLSVGATLLASLAPILSLRHLAPAGALGDGSRSVVTGRSTTRTRQFLVGAQFALSLALVVSATLLVRTLYNLKSIPTGLDVDHVALISVNPEAVQYDAARIRQYLDEAERRLAGLPGVRAAGYGRVIPLGFGGSRVTIFVPDYQPRPDEDMELNYNVVSPRYFDAVGASIVDGRAFDDSDVLGRPVAAVVNETMARRYWPGQRAVGQEMRFGSETGPLFQVVGVAKDVKYRTMREEAGPSFYYSLAQGQRPHGGVLHVRTNGDPALILGAIRRTLAELDPVVPIGDARTLREQVDVNVADERLAMTIGALLGGAALLLAAVGLYGAMSSMVGQRTREIGVRIALGASPGDVSRLVLRQGVRIALAGSLLGMGLAFWISRLIVARLYGVTSSDVSSYVIAVGVLTSVALVASWAPARRAASVDPIDALR